MINTEFSARLGMEFAKNINGTADAADWSPLDGDDDIAESDWDELISHYGKALEESEPLRAVEAAYKNGFNSVLCPLMPQRANFSGQQNNGDLNMLTEQEFLKDVAEHQMIVIRDDDIMNAFVSI